MAEVDAVGELVLQLPLDLDRTVGLLRQVVTVDEGGGEPRVVGADLFDRLRCHPVGLDDTGADGVVEAILEAIDRSLDLASHGCCLVGTHSRSAALGGRFAVELGLPGLVVYAPLGGCDLAGEGVGLVGHGELLSEGLSMMGYFTPGW